ENFFAPKPGDEAAYQNKVAQLAAVIAAANPDLVGLEEVGDPESFEALRAALGAGWNGVLSTHFQPSHAIRVGWLSRRVMSDIEEVVDLPTGCRRSRSTTPVPQSTSSAEAHSPSPTPQTLAPTSEP